MTLGEQQRKFMSLLPRLIDYVYDQGWSVTLGDGYRHPDAIFPYPVHPNTMHGKRLAVDLNFFNDQGEYVTEGERLTPFGEYWLSLDELCTWGGAEDGNHFSYAAHKHGMTF